MASQAENKDIKQFKILLIGDVRVGKTSFLTRYIKNVVIKAEKPTIGVDFATKNLVMKDGTIAKAKLWDTAGSEKYIALTVAHYREAQGALLFFDITDRTTFENLSFWLSKIEDHAEKDTKVMLVGNKYDLAKENPDDRQISTQQAEKFAKDHGLMYFETSAKSGYNVKEAFETLVEAIHDFQKDNMSEEAVRKQKEAKMRIKIDQNFSKTGENNEPKTQQDSCCA